ncbi:AAA family ATPase [Cohnella thailandensis]|uniref:ATP-binding protein n=1 Tax=Cohnella thailandensis TaxID=557557 RepID=A0A841T1L2_9BACL|nr:AAA family ATPase [Cohnella thailandensis]MBB6636939.1 ATP-binding protein [Cohnella thailandensis]MBP1973179.1 dephospho-CoA kinase [Cohnella thailandensis]
MTELGQLIFVAGSAGAGKTTVARELAKRNKAAFLDMDTFARPASERIMALAGLDPEDRDSDEYKKLCRDLGYRMTMNAALDNIELGIDAIVVGPFTRETESDEWLEEELGRLRERRKEARVKAIYVFLNDLELYRRRIEQRQLASDEWKLRNWERFSRSLAVREVKWKLPEGSILYFNNEEELSEEKLARLSGWVKESKD